jgi:membrane peptidoglycan carboxypeptidase
VNTVYAQLASRVGPSAVAATARRLGVTTIDPTKNYGVSIALGSAEVSPLDMAGAYAVFANHGVRAPVTPVVRVVGPDGHVLEDNSAPRGDRVMDAAVSDTLTDVIRGVVQYGTGRAASIGRPVAGKTGTSEDYRAAWFVGYTPQLATSVWMGYADAPRPLHDIGGYGSITGGTLPAIAWAAFMQSALTNVPIVQFTPPGPLPLPGGVASIGAPARDSVGGVPTSCGGLCDRASSDSSAKSSKKSSMKTDSSTSAKAKDAKTTTTTAKGTDHG